MSKKSGEKLPSKPPTAFWLCGWVIFVPWVHVVFSIIVLLSQTTPNETCWMVNLGLLGVICGKPAIWPAA